MKRRNQKKRAGTRKRAQERASRVPTGTPVYFRARVSASAPAPFNVHDPARVVEEYRKMQVRRALMWQELDARS